MDFALNEEQQMLRKSARDFLKTECPKTLVRELEESEAGYSPEIWTKMSELGWMGIVVPEEFGGIEWSLLDQAVLFEEFGRAAMPGPMLANLMGTLAILEGGSEEQKGKILPGVASGKTILSMALEESEAVCDPRFVSLKASPKDDNYIITGSKLFVSYAHIADHLIVVARTSGEPGNEKGLTVFMVDGKTPGITLTTIKNIAADKLFRVDFNNVTVSSSDIMGTPDSGFALISPVLSKAMAIQCAEMVGGAQQELTMTAEHTRTRVQFDRPVGTFQAVQHRLADMFIDVQSARWTTYQAIWRLSQAMPADKELAIAKFITGSACQRVAFSAQQLHGGIGVDLDFDLHFYYRREKAMELSLGTPAFHLDSLGASFGL